MILLLDVGNTRIKWGIWHDGAWREHGAVPVAEAESLFAVAAVAGVTWAAISCVAGDAVRARLAALFEERGVATRWLTPGAAGHGVINRYERPELLGADRYAAMIACFRADLTPCVVVSAGTAVTIDALAGNGEFLGGMILPGPVLMRQALGSGTAEVKSLTGNWRPFPRCTGDAVETGIWTAISASVRAMQARLAEGQGQVAIIVTGGDRAKLAARLAAEMPRESVATSEYLVLEGLLWVARDSDVPGA